MPIYIRFLRHGRPVGGTTAAGRHHNGMDILGISWGPMATSLNEIVVTKSMDSTTPPLIPKGTDGIAAELDFTRVHRSGAEVSDLRVMIHDVSIVRQERAVLSGRAAPVERIVLRYSKMTRAGAPAAADISQQIRARLAQGHV